jgi:hypothetical protein
MTEKNKPEVKPQSGEIAEGRVVHVWEEKSVPIRVASGDLVYNVPASRLVDESKSK